jgi:type IV secretory pathway TrbD component
VVTLNSALTLVCLVATAAAAVHTGYSEWLFGVVIWAMNVGLQMAIREARSDDALSIGCSVVGIACAVGALLK